MKIVVVLVLVVLAVNAGPAMKWYEIQPALDTNNDVRLSEDNIRVHWEAFKKQYSKSYSELEEKSRYEKFSKNFVTILQHNSEEAMGLHSYRLGLNEFADMDSLEISKKMNGYRRPKNYTRTGSIYVKPKLTTPLPATADWRTKGYVTPVKNQGQCGSCWAFSATGAVEGQHFGQTGKLVSLSEQNLMDCSSSQCYGNHGCAGGLVDYAFNYITVKGIDTEQSYPYTGVEDYCTFSKANIGATISKYADLPIGDESSLQVASALIGPISVAIDASQASFHLYKSGIYDEPDCSSKKLDHAVLVVGYGTENGTNYWLVKNSWGESWGENGYIKMSRNKNNQCGIATQASYPFV